MRHPFFACSYEMQEVLDNVQTTTEKIRPGSMQIRRKPFPFLHTKAEKIRILIISSRKT